MCMLLCDFVCIASLLPFVLRFCPSIFVFFILLKNFFFLIIIFILITILFILFYFILVFLSFFSPFYSEPCGGQALGAPARRPS